MTIETKVQASFLLQVGLQRILAHRNSGGALWKGMQDDVSHADFSPNLTCTTLGHRRTSTKCHQKIDQQETCLRFILQLRRSAPLFLNAMSMQLNSGRRSLWPWDQGQVGSRPRVILLLWIGTVLNGIPIRKAILRKSIWRKSECKI